MVPNEPIRRTLELHTISARFLHWMNESYTLIYDISLSPQSKTSFDVLTFHKVNINKQRENRALVTNELVEGAIPPTNFDTIRRHLRL